MYYADDQYYEDLYVYHDNKDDESYDAEDDYDELCESFDAICETKSVLLANQSASDDAMAVKAQSNVVNDVKVQTNDVNAVKLSDYVNFAQKVPDIYTEPVVDNQTQNIDDYDDYSNQSVFVGSAQKVDICNDKNVYNSMKQSTLYDMFDDVDLCLLPQQKVK